MDDSSIIRRQLDVYRPAVLRHGDAPEATFATGRETQSLRFERLMAPVLDQGLRSFSLHDVGAGLCDLHGWLTEREIVHAYSATEIVPEMVELARRKYPGLPVHRRDLLAGPVPDDRHHVVVQSGMFNIPGDVPRDEWERFVEAMLERMFAMATVGISFNFLSAYRTRTDPDLHYVDPRGMVDFCVRRLSRFVRLDASYPLFEATVCVLRPEYVAARFDDDAYGRYFRPGTANPGADGA